MAGPRKARRRLPRGLAGALAGAAGLLVVSAGEGFGQNQDEPLRLVPVQEIELDDADAAAPGGDSSPTPAADALSEGSGDAGGEEGGRAGSPGEGGIVVGTLDAIDPDAAGVILPGVEPFPAEAWAGSRRVRIEALLPHLPGAIRSPAMRRLALALLASRAHPPVGEGEPGTLVLSRAKRLVAIGAREYAIALLETAGPPGGKEAIARIGSDRHLASLDFESACEQARGKASAAGDGYWRRVRILCHAQGGLIEAAMLGLELLHESDAAPDDPFDETIYAMAGLAEPVLEGLEEPTPLRVAAWRLAQFPIPAEAVSAAAPDVLPAIAGAPEVSPAVRLLAAERAWATGVLPIETLRGLYREMVFSPEERAEPLSQGVGLETPLLRALLLQAVEAQTVPTLRAELVAAAIGIVREQAAETLMAHALADLVRTIPPAPEHGWFSGVAGRVLMAAGDGDAASAWYALARAQAPRDAEAARAALQLWPTLLLSGDAEAPTAADFDAWLAFREQDSDPDFLIDQMNLLLLLLDALETPIEPEIWDRALSYEVEQGAWEPAPVLDRALREAAGEGRLGETVLMALLLLGESGPDRAGLAAVETVVSALVSVGLKEEARAIALEAARAARL